MNLWEIFPENWHSINLNDIRNCTYNRVQLAGTFGKLTVSIHLDHENQT